MKTGMVLGIIGGVIALIIGAVGFSLTSGLESLGSAAHNANQSMGFNTSKPPSLVFYSYASIILPILALVWAGIASKNAILSAALMGGSAVLMLFVFGIGVLSLIPSVLLIIGAFLVFNDREKVPQLN